MAVPVQTLGQRGGDDAGHLGRTGEHDGGNARIGHQRGTHLHAITRQQLQHIGRNAGFVQDPDGFCGDQRRLFGRFGDDRVAGTQCGRDLAGEDGQREVPRADAQHGTQRPVRIVAELGGYLVAVVAQEVDGLADLGDGVGQRFAGLAYDQTHQHRHAVFHQLGGAQQAGSTVGRLGGLPDRGGCRGRFQGGVDVGRRGFDHVAHHVVMVGRVQHRFGLGRQAGSGRLGGCSGALAFCLCIGLARCAGILAGLVRAAGLLPGTLGRFAAGAGILAGGCGCVRLRQADRCAIARLGQPGFGGAGQQAARQGRQFLLVGQVDAGGVGALAEYLGGVQVHRQRDVVVRRAQRRDAGGFLDGVGDQLVDRQVGVADTVDERRVGAIFQQAADQIGQQRLVRAHRGIHAAWTAQAAFGHGFGDLFVQRFTHAVQALEFVLAGVVVPAGQFVDGGQCLRVVRGEHRIDGVGHF